jgi:hypothetical protein
LVSVLSIILYKCFFHNSTHALGGSSDADSDNEGDGRGQQEGDGKPIQNPVPSHRCPSCLERGETFGSSWKLLSPGGRGTPVI